MQRGAASSSWTPSRRAADCDARAQHRRSQSRGPERAFAAPAGAPRRLSLPRRAGDRRSCLSHGRAAQDLRLHDNAALLAALRDASARGGRVVRAPPARRVDGSRGTSDLVVVLRVGRARAAAHSAPPTRRAAAGVCVRVGRRGGGVWLRGGARHSRGSTFGAGQSRSRPTHALRRRGRAVRPRRRRPACAGCDRACGQPRRCSSAPVAALRARCPRSGRRTRGCSARGGPGVHCLARAPALPPVFPHSRVARLSQGGTSYARRPGYLLREPESVAIDMAGRFRGHFGAPYSWLGLACARALSGAAPLRRNDVAVFSGMFEAPVRPRGSGAAT